MASPFTVTSVSNYNANPPSDDGAQTASNRVQWSTQKTKLADPVYNAFNTSETNTSTAFGKVVGGATITTTAVDYTVTSSDQSKIVKCTVSGKTITTPDATVVGAPFVFFVSNTSTGSITLDGNGTQTIDGLTTITLPAGTGLMLNTDGTNWFSAGRNFNLTPSLIPNYISGLTLSAAGSVSTFGVASGVANDSTNATMLSLASAYTKTTASWAVGTGNGALDTGAIANSTWYHVYLIYRPDTAVVDVLVSLSATSPTLPTNYTLFRRIGSMKTDGSAHWTQFVQNGNEFIWTTTVADANPANVTSTASLQTLSVPTGVKVNALFRGTISSSTAQVEIIFTSPDESDQSISNNALLDLITPNAANAISSGRFNVRTNTSAQIRTRSNLVGGINCYIGTFGWIDNRGFI